MLNQQLKHLPDVSFACNKNGNYSKWFYKKDGKRNYITKANRPLAEKFAMKEYLSCAYSDALQEKKAIDLYLNSHNSYSSKVDKILQNPDFIKLISPNFRDFPTDITAWINEKYEQSTQHPEKLKHPTISGHIVRSKSEALIATLLFTHKIPFRYECALHLGNVVYYPDFTIMHPITKKILYWEHFGQMDKPSYYNKVYPKLSLYNSNNIISSINLITTFETQDNPLTSQTIENIIENYFGPLSSA